MKKIKRRFTLILLVLVLSAGRCAAFAETRALIRTGYDGVENMMGIFGAIYSEGKVYFNRGYDICAAFVNGSGITVYNVANYQYNDDTEAYFRYLYNDEKYPFDVYSSNSVVSGMALMDGRLVCVRIDEYSNQGQEYSRRKGIGATLCEAVETDGGLDMRVLYDLQWDGMENVPIMSGCAVAGGILAMRPDDMYILEGNPPYVLFFTLTSDGICRGEAVEIPGLRNVFNGRDGGLWCSVYENGVLNIYILTENGTGEQLFTLPVSGYISRIHATYSPFDDRLYLADDNTVYYTGADESGEFALPISRTCGIVPAEGGIVAFNAMNGVFTDGLNTQDICITVIGTFFNDPIAEEYMFEHPGVQVKYRYMDDVEQIATAILTGNTDAALYMFSTGWGPMVRNIIDRGYAAELTDERIISESGRLYPRIHDYISRDGKLYGACLNILSPYAFAVDGYVIKNARINPDDLPATWIELFDFIDAWGDNYASNDTRLFDDGYTAEELRRIMLGRLYLDYAMNLRNGDFESFDTPEFRALLERLKKVDFTAATNFEAHYPPLILDVPIQCESGMWNMVPLTLRISEETEYIAPMGCSVVMANPSSENIDVAQDFIAFTLENLDAVTQGNLYTDAPDSARPGDQSEIVSTLKADLEMYTFARQDAGEDVEYIYDELIEQLEKQIAYYENDYFIYTSESMEQYREYAQHISVYEGLTLSAREDEILTNVLNSYLSGTMSDDAFIKELDRRYTMDIKEGR